MGRHCRAAMVLMAVLACSSLAAAASTVRRRRALKAADWHSVTVVNRCNEPVAFRAGYNFYEGIDDGHRCPNKGDGAIKPLDVCSTDWQTIGPDESVDAGELPDSLWWYSAYVEGTDSPVYLNQGSAEAFLGGPEDFNAACDEPDNGTCVWWSIPDLNMAGTRLVLKCPTVDGEAAPAPAVDSTVDVINNCSVPIKIKVAYSLPIGDDNTTACMISEWRTGTDHLCVTDYQLMEPGEERMIADSSQIFWVYGAHVADDPSYDLGKLAMGAFQASNDTTACPEKDVYGSGYVCEWWAPRYATGEELNGTEPLVVSCPDYVAQA